MNTNLYVVGEGSWVHVFTPLRGCNLFESNTQDSYKPGLCVWHALKVLYKWPVSRGGDSDRLPWFLKEIKKEETKTMPASSMDQVTVFFVLFLPCPVNNKCQNIKMHSQYVVLSEGDVFTVAFHCLCRSLFYHTTPVSETNLFFNHKSMSCVWKWAPPLCESTDSGDFLRLLFVKGVFHGIWRVWLCHKCLDSFGERLGIPVGVVISREGNWVARGWESRTYCPHCLPFGTCWMFCFVHVFTT